MSVSDLHNPCHLRLEGMEDAHERGSSAISLENLRNEVRYGAGALIHHR